MRRISVWRVVALVVGLTLALVLLNASVVTPTIAEAWTQVPAPAR